MKIGHLIALLSWFYLSACGSGTPASTLPTGSEPVSVFGERPLGSSDTVNDVGQDATPDIDVSDGQNAEFEDPSTENTDATNTIGADLPPVFDFTLSVENNRRVLHEGDLTGTSFSIEVVAAENQIVDIEVRALTESDAKLVLFEISDQRLDADNNNTTITFTLPVGIRPILEHERRFEVVAISGDQMRALDLILDVKPVEVPDIYLLIGQSNMVGRTGDGTKDAKAGGSDETNPRIRQLNVSRNDSSLFSSNADFSDPDKAAVIPRYSRAQDPLHQPLKSDEDIKSGTTVGPGLSFAKSALNSTTQKIYLVPAAWESSGFCRIEAFDKNFAWNASQTNKTSLGGSGLLERALIRLRMTMRDTDGIFRGILWQQGETDSTNKACADSYANNLKLMVERIRTEARVDRRGESARGPQAPIPFIVSTQSRGEDERGDFSRWSDDKQKVDSVHRNISSLVPFSDWVNNDDLVPPSYPCGSTGCIHFGSLASREIGQRSFEAWERIWKDTDQ